MCVTFSTAGSITAASDRHQRLASTRCTLPTSIHSSQPRKSPPPPPRTLCGQSTKKRPNQPTATQNNKQRRSRSFTAVLYTKLLYRARSLDHHTTEGGWVWIDATIPTHSPRSGVFLYAELDYSIQVVDMEDEHTRFSRHVTEQLGVRQFGSLGIPLQQSCNWCNRAAVEAPHSLLKFRSLPMYVSTTHLNEPFHRPAFCGGQLLQACP